MSSRLNTEISDQLLVQQLKEGCEKAFKVLYKKYSNDIYAYSRSLLKSDTYAEEIVQEVFLKIWTYRHQLDNTTSFKSFLFTIARNFSYNFLRKSSKNRALREAIFYKSQVTQPKTQDEQLIEAEYEHIQTQVLALLPPKRRQIFEMSRQEGKTYREISEELNISISTVKSQVSKALKTIREYLALHTDLTFVVSIILTCWLER